MNSFRKLRWDFQPLSLSTTFLDLNIVLTPPHISFSTYQKPHNLYLYIPPNSAHPPGVIRSLIHGLLRRYWSQNTDPRSFQRITKLLFQRLLARGHSHENLLNLFLDASKSLHPRPYSSPQTTTFKNEIFLKWRFHPLDITRRAIRHSYRHTCEMPSFNAPQGFRLLHTDEGSSLQIDKFTIAYTRYRNLRDLLIPSRLPNLPNYDVSSFIPPQNTENSTNNFTSGAET